LINPSSRSHPVALGYIRYEIDQRKRNMFFVTEDVPQVEKDREKICVAGYFGSETLTQTQSLAEKRRVTDVAEKRRVTDAAEKKRVTDAESVTRL